MFTFSPQCFAWCNRREIEKYLLQQKIKLGVFTCEPCEQSTKPWRVLRHILKITSANKFKPNHCNVPHPADSQQCIDLSRYIRVVPYRLAKEEMVLWVMLEKQEVQPSVQHRVTSTWHCPASSQGETIYCHTVCQQQPEVMDSVNTVEHCSKFPNFKKRKGTTIFFASWDKST